jgi:hypothetical protein
MSRRCDVLLIDESTNLDKAGVGYLAERLVPTGKQTLLVIHRDELVAAMPQPIVGERASVSRRAPRLAERWSVAERPWGWRREGPGALSTCAVATHCSMLSGSPWNGSDGRRTTRRLTLRAMEVAPARTLLP